MITLASTHSPEEENLLRQLQTHLNSNPDLFCIVVPRHPERFDEVYKICQSLNLNTQRRSLKQPIQIDTQVFLPIVWVKCGYGMPESGLFVGGSLNEPGEDIIFWNRWF